MKAIILASGEGKRLYPLTKKIPKPLLKIGGKELLGRQIENLLEYGINKIIVTTGPFKEEVERFVRTKYPKADTIFVNNRRYKSTNYIYSLWLTKKYVDDDVILLHGDLLFDGKLIGNMLESDKNLVLLNRKIKPPKKDFKAVIDKKKVTRIGVDFSGKNAFACLPIYKLCKEDLLQWLEEIEKYVKVNDVNIYAENIFNKVSDRIVLYPLYFEDELCMEIDTKEDIEIAENLV